MKKLLSLLFAILFIAVSLISCNTDKSGSDIIESDNDTVKPAVEEEINFNIELSENVRNISVPAYSGDAYVPINDNNPYFLPDEIKNISFEEYSNLDDLGRCGTAFASIGKDIMPTEDRGSIGQVKPSGWQTVKYDIVDGKYLYNRCHLIGFQLSGENANPENLITGTRYLNVVGMLPFENMVADFVKETDYHVMYRVTPVFLGDDLVAVGVIMEAFSVEDNGEGILFNVFCYNVQPGITVNYKNGDSDLSGEKTINKSENNVKKESKYVLNINSKKIHKENCSEVAKIKDVNRQDFSGDPEIYIKQGFSYCKMCNK